MTENTLNGDISLFENEITCFNSSSLIDCSLFKYDVLFDEVEITPSVVSCNTSLLEPCFGSSRTCVEGSRSSYLTHRTVRNLFEIT